MAEDEEEDRHVFDDYEKRNPDKQPITRRWNYSDRAGYANAPEGPAPQSIPATKHIDRILTGDRSSDLGPRKN